MVPVVVAAVAVAVGIAVEVEAVVVVVVVIINKKVDLVVGSVDWGACGTQLDNYRGK